MHLKQQKREAERAWDHLTAAMETTGKRTKRLAGDAQHKVTATSDEARRRASAAMDALAGNKPRRPWSWLAGALAIGAVLGWLGTKFGRRAVTETTRLIDREPTADELLASEPATLAGRPM